LVRRITIFLGRPIAASIIIAAMIGWCTLNMVVAARGAAPPDPPPFQWLELVISAVALVVVFLVLATQQRDEELAQVHQQVTLQLAIAAEQKAAKMIELLELLRKDHPSIPDRRDEKASEMARPADPESVVSAIKLMTG
jgi:uncharacterized membrane protein